MSENRVLRKIFGCKGNGENYTMRSIMICTLHQIFSGRLNQGAICLNGKIILKLIMDCIQRAEDRNKQQAILRTVMNLRFIKIHGIA